MTLTPAKLVESENPAPGVLSIWNTKRKGGQKPAFLHPVEKDYFAERYASITLASFDLMVMPFGPSPMRVITTFGS